MKKRDFQLGLIGWPLEHSLSPIIHTAAMQAMGLGGAYRLLPVRPTLGGDKQLRALLDRTRSSELDGLNVTRPYKTTVMKHLDELTPVAEAIGAVNTIFAMDGRLVGDNTDKDGFLFDLEATLSPEVGGALILGSGGAARAVALGLAESGWQVWVSARSLDRAQALANGLQSRGAAISGIQLSSKLIESISSECKLIVNATPLGMFPQTNTSPWPADVPLPPAVVVYDLVYAPRETVLTIAASEAGLAAVTGLGMLVEQAALSFERWTGLTAPRSLMHQTAQTALSIQKPTGGG
ncbi:MAG: shikimate dehydrogenase [Anaerolineales bacterium]